MSKIAYITDQCKERNVVVANFYVLNLVLLKVVI
jgi:hypothetical protein